MNTKCDNIGSLIFGLSSICTLLACRHSLRKKSRQIGESDQRVTCSAATGTTYDVVIVGAGPAGATAAYYMGKQGLKVALIDKRSFPRPKPCGDAWCKPALDILEDMGVLEKMESDGIARPVRRGGFISPFGYRCINTDGAAYGSVSGCKTYAIKRGIADEYIVRAAASLPSVHLLENTEISNAIFVESADAGFTGYYRLIQKNESLESISAVMCLICDGSTSYLGQKLGLIPKGSQAEAVCSHAYVRGGTHDWQEADGVMLFNRSILPGYTALFRHYNDDMYLGTYVLPGGKATSRAIAPFEDIAIREHPYVKSAFGLNYEWKEKRVVAPIRCGGVAKSYDKQILLVGDAAGHVDPLTGEGIHTAMIAGKIAAKSVGEMFRKTDFSIDACRAYEMRCYDAFGYEFVSSSLVAKIIYHVPIVLDAVAVVGQRRGQAFLDFFGEVMTGVRPKSDFAQPLLVLDIALELVHQLFIQYILLTKPLIPVDIGVDIVKKQSGKKTGRFA